MVLDIFEAWKEAQVKGKKPTKKAKKRTKKEGP